MKNCNVFPYEVLVSELRLSVHNTTLPFGHLNLYCFFFFGTHHIVFVCLFEASDNYFAL